MKSKDIIVMNNLIVLARNLVEEGSEHDPFLWQLEKCDANFRRYGPTICREIDFRRYAKTMLDIFGKIIDGANRCEVDSIAQDIISKTYNRSNSGPEACGLVIYKPKPETYTGHQIPKERDEWLEPACNNDHKVNVRPEAILFEKHIKYYNSLSPLEKALVHAAHRYKGGCENLIASCRNMPNIVKAARKIQNYELRYKIVLDAYEGV